jgi:hypothetical protein
MINILYIEHITCLLKKHKYKVQIFVSCFNNNMLFFPKRALRKKWMIGYKLSVLHLLLFNIR